MRIVHIELAESSSGGHRVCCQAKVTYADRRGFEERYWFDVPEALADQLTLSGNPWLVLFAPLVVHLREPLEIDARVDAELLRNVRELITIWSCWYPELSPVPIEAIASEVDLLGGQDHRTASLFSGGVDAWFSLIRHTDDGVQARINDLLTIWGLDIPLSGADGFSRMKGITEEAASAFGCDAVDVAVNLRETRWWRDADWGLVAHGPALAATALVLEPRYRHLITPSTHHYDSLIPWGSHPLTDTLLSSSGLRVLHDGGALTRVGTIQRTAELDLVKGS